MKSWYVVNTKPHSEFKVINYLNSKNITIFMPKLLVSRSHARQVKKVLRPLFPSYFFVYINIEHSFRLVKSAIGVKGMLTNGNIPTCVHHDVMKNLFNNTDTKGIVKRPSINEFQIGQKIEINEGIFKGKIGSFYSMPAKDRIAVLLDFFGRKSKISISILNVASA